MTTELEKQFFDTFGIEPKCETRDEYHKHECYGMVDCDECASAIYPQITDRHYLELISAQLRVDKLTNVTFAPNNTHTSTLKGLQELILGGSILCYETLLKNNFIKAAEDYKHQVQAIFKGEK